jgi:8-oxo-dGTP pyrophosphatase MutT (NUDIX family)
MRVRILSAFEGAGGETEEAEDGVSWLRQSGDPEVADFTEAAVLLPLIDHARGMTVLLTQRTAHLKSHAGQISFPGGRFEDGDHSPEATALRETEEEIGLPREHIEVVGRLGARRTGTGFRVIPVVGLIDPPMPIAPDPNEVAEVFEVPLDFVIDPANHRFETRLHGGVERQFYAMTFDDYYIWGLTARLLVNLSEVLRR